MRYLTFNNSVKDYNIQTKALTRVYNDLGQPLPRLTENDKSQPGPEEGVVRLFNYFCSLKPDHSDLTLQFK